MVNEFRKVYRHESFTKVCTNKKYRVPVTLVAQGCKMLIYFIICFEGLDSIDETSMTYAADIFFAQTWKDHRLRLPENMTQEYRLIEVDWLKSMWRPDSFFKNAKSVTFQTMTIPNHYLWMYRDKTILYMVKLTLRLSCAMNFAIYPHDTQECKLQMESCEWNTFNMYNRR